MKLPELIERQDVVGGAAPPALEVGGVQCDSRRVRPGDLFVALHGVRENGARYAAAAAAKGAVAVVSDGPPDGGAGVPWIQVRDARRTLAQLACALNGHPSRTLAVHAATGTNGKTTTVWLARDMLRAAGRNPGLVSTVQYEYNGRELKASRTTPDACELQGLFAAMRTAGCDSVVMEVSSHAIDQHRVAGVRFASAAFTNLSRDHLDYHRDMETYFRVKERLFIQLAAENPGATAILNADDPHGRRLIGSSPARGLVVVTYGFEPSAEICATGVQLSAEGTRFTLIAPGGRAEIRARLLGRYNVSNMLCASAIALRAGVPFDRVAGVLEAAQPRWGRLERVETPLPATVFVDYAHTDDALDKVLTTLREITRGRLLVVFGCGGNRDRTKRPLMGRVAAEKADHAIVTSDNPRQEPPADIIREIVAGMPAGRSHEIVPDRREAILAALRQGRANDVIVIAGKGHETTQEFDNRSIPFDDREEVRNLAAQVMKETAAKPEADKGTAAKPEARKDAAPKPAPKSAPRPSRVPPASRTTPARLSRTSRENVGPLLAADELARWTGGTWEPRGVPVRGVSNRSGELSPGSLYVALRGARFDGHDFLAQAAARGAAAALVRRDWQGETPLPLLRVDDPRAALAAAATGYRRTLFARVAGVTGSVGKTVTKEWIAAFFRADGQTAATAGNLNNDIGLPLSLLAAPRDVRRAVFELGSNHPGEIVPLARMLAPDAAVLTAIGPVHLEHFGTLEAIANEKADLLRALPADGLAVLDADGAFFDYLRRQTTARVVTVSLTHNRADYLGRVQEEWRGTLDVIGRADGERVTLTSGLPGRHHAANLLLAVALAREMGVPWAVFESALRDLRLPGMRWQRSEGNGRTVINDAYNANPLSMACALQTFAGMPEKGRRALVLGDMLELGPTEEALHRETGRTVAGGPWLALVCVGARARWIADEAVAAGFAAGQVWRYDDAAAAAADVAAWARPGDVVLVKASRGIGLERVAAALAGEKEAAPKGR